MSFSDALLSNGAVPRSSLALASAASAALFFQTKLLSSRPQEAVMLLTKMSNRPVLSRSPKSIDMPLNESCPSTMRLRA